MVICPWPLFTVQQIILELWLCAMWNASHWIRRWRRHGSFLQRDLSLSPEVQKNLRQQPDRKSQMLCFFFSFLFLESRSRRCIPWSDGKTAVSGKVPGDDLAPDLGSPRASLRLWCWRVVASVFGDLAIEREEVWAVFTLIWWGC